jgi:hypothetical protein
MKDIERALADIYAVFRSQKWSEVWITRLDTIAAAYRAQEQLVQRICRESGVVLFGDGEVRNHRAEQAEARVKELEVIASGRTVSCGSCNKAEQRVKELEAERDEAFRGHKVRQVVPIQAWESALAERDQAVRERDKMHDRLCESAADPKDETICNLRAQLAAEKYIADAVNLRKEQEATIKSQAEEIAALKADDVTAAPYRHLACKKKFEADEATIREQAAELAKWKQIAVEADEFRPLYEQAEDKLASLEAAVKVKDEALAKYRVAMDALYNHNEAVRAAVIQYFGTLHPQAALSPAPKQEAPAPASALTDAERAALNWAHTIPLDAIADILEGVGNDLYAEELRQLDKRMDICVKAPAPTICKNLGHSHIIAVWPECADAAVKPVPEMKKEGA